MNQTELTDFGTRYAAAWSSQHPVSLASFYNENGSLTVNGNAASVGHTAITETARLVPMASLRSRRVTSMRRSTNAS